MKTAVARLFESLQGVGRLGSVEELLDALWIAPHLTVEPTTREPQPASAEAATTETPPPIPASDLGSRKESNQPPRFPVESAGSSTTQDRPGQPIRLPAGAPPLRGREVLRALRGFRRMVPSRQKWELDVDATVELRSQTRLPLIQVRPEPENAVSVCLVIDSSASMEVWAQTARAWVRLVTASGVFRSVRLLHLDADGEAPKLRAWRRFERGMQPAQPSSGRASRIAVGAGSVVLVLSDFCSRAWWNGSAFRQFAVWGRNSDVALVGLLPQTFWPRTAIGQARFVHLVRPAGGGRLEMEALPFFEAGDVLPIASLEVSSLLTLSGLIGHNRREVGGTGVWIASEPPANPEPSPGAEPRRALELSAEERVQKFLGAASSEAARLAGLLVLFDRLTVQTLQLIRGAARLRATAVQDAEVLLGGLLHGERVERGGRWVWEYQFHPRVREVLRKQTAWREPEPQRFFERFREYLKRRRNELNGIHAAIPRESGESQIRAMEDQFLDMDEEMLAGLSPEVVPLADELKSIRGLVRTSEIEKSSISDVDSPGISVYISYRRQDSQYQASRIYDRLISHFGPVSVFNELGTVPFGLDFRDLLPELVAGCDILIAVIGEDWLSISDNKGNRRLDDPDDFVRFEIEAALKRGIPVIPVLLGDTPLPRSDELPESLHELSDRNAVVVRSDPDFDNDMKRLIRGIEIVVSTFRENAAKELAQPDNVPEPEETRPTAEPNNLPDSGAGEAVVESLERIDAGKTETAEPVRQWSPAIIHPLGRASDSIGHEQEVDWLNDWVDDPDHPDRIVALIGPAYVGKMAIAGRVVSRLAERTDAGIFVWSFFVAPDPNSFLLEASEYFGDQVPASSVGSFESLRSALSDKLPHLIVFEGLEKIQATNRFSIRPRLPGGEQPELEKIPAANKIARRPGRLTDPQILELLSWVAEAKETRAKILVTSHVSLTDFTEDKRQGYRELLIGRKTSTSFIPQTIPGSPARKTGLPLQFILLVDCSGSMAGPKIEAVNQAIRDALVELGQVSDANPNANLLVRAITFGSGASWHLETPTPASEVVWEDMTTGGSTDLGAALHLLAKARKYGALDDLTLTPVIVLLTDGRPTDDFDSGITSLLEQPWARKAVRIAVAIGDLVTFDFLQQFASGDIQPLVLQAKRASDLTTIFRWISGELVRTVARGGVSVSRIFRNLPRLPDAAESASEEIW